MNEIIAVSIVPPTAFVPEHQLHTLDLASVMYVVCAMLVATGVVDWAVLGLDISFNVMSAKGLPNGWQAQVYAIVSTSNRRKLRDQINKCLPKTSAVQRPVRTKQFDGSAKGASYVLKFQFVQRTSYRDKSDRWNTWKAYLRAPQHKELMLALDQFGLASRLAVIGVPLREFKMRKAAM